MRFQLRRGLAAVLLAGAAGGALGLSACGGGGDKENATELLDKAFHRPIRSADVKIDATIQARGISGFDKPIRLKALGPYRENRDKLPSFDIDLEVAAGGGGQVISTGRLSTGDRVFVKFEDAFYELPPRSVERANRALRANRRQRSLLKGIGLDARSWIADAKVAGHDQVAGVETKHVVGTLDVERLLRDLNRFVQRSGSALGAAAGQVPRPLTRSQRKQIGEIVKDPRFHVYVGEEDDTIRRLSTRVDLHVPKEDRGKVGGLQSGSLELSIEFSKVNGHQRIEPPARARRLSALTKSLGTAALNGGIGDSVPRSRRGAATAGPDADAFKRYAKCLDEAHPNDTAALQRCTKVLRR